VARLYAELVKALLHEEVKVRLAADGAEPVGSTPAEFSAFIRGEIAKWTRVARAANIHPE
jgi:tripartite-type tricarboxylate transporter receptor subunit TctC